MIKKIGQKDIMLKMYIKIKKEINTQQLKNDTACTNFRKGRQKKL